MLLLPLAAHGQTYFKDGMEWVTRLNGTHAPKPVFVHETIALEGDTLVGGMPALKMFCTNDTDGQRTLIAVIRTEGEKVYFKTAAYSDEWYLMYDFGLQPGEGCYVYYLPRHANDLYKSYIKCVGEADNSEYGGWAAMRLEEYPSDACEQLYGSGVWLKGLGCPNGVVENTRFEDDGGGRLLLEAAYNGRTIYSKKTTGVSPIAAAPAGLRIDGTNVYISHAEAIGSVSLYTDSGLLLNSRYIPGREAHIALPGNGIYLLKTGQQTHKISVF